MKKQGYRKTMLCAGWDGLACGRPVQPGRYWCPEHEKVRIAFLDKRFKELAASFKKERGEE